jgi:hypothetical protein
VFFFVPIATNIGLSNVHPICIGTFILNAYVYLFPIINFARVPVMLFEFPQLAIV